MSNLRKAAEMALEALSEYTCVVTSGTDPTKWDEVVDGGGPARKAIEALRQALAQPEQDRDSTFAGVRMWIGGKNIEYWVSKTCIEHEAIEGMSMSMAANSCLQALKENKHD